eukprot:5766696-Ditylum_brightwellii.AAC.1
MMTPVSHPHQKSGGGIGCMVANQEKTLLFVGEGTSMLVYSLFSFDIIKILQGGGGRGGGGAENGYLCMDL